MPGKKRAHYSGDYWKRSAVVRHQAQADPTTRCWRCGLTLDEVRRTVNPTATWDAGHLRDGDPHSPLRPECSPCNRSNGARVGNARRSPPTRRG